MQAACGDRGFQLIQLRVGQTRRGTQGLEKSGPGAGNDRAESFERKVGDAFMGGPREGACEIVGELEGDSGHEVCRATG